MWQHASHASHKRPVVNRDVSTSQPVPQDHVPCHQKEQYTRPPVDHDQTACSDSPVGRATLQLKRTTTGRSKTTRHYGNKLVDSSTRSSKQVSGQMQLRKERYVHSIVLTSYKLTRWRRSQGNRRHASCSINCEAESLSGLDKPFVDQPAQGASASMTNSN